MMFACCRRAACPVAASCPWSKTTAFLQCPNRQTNLKPDPCCAAGQSETAQGASVHLTHLSALVCICLAECELYVGASSVGAVHQIIAKGAKVWREHGYCISSILYTGTNLLEGLSPSCHAEVAISFSPDSDQMLWQIACILYAIAPQH